MKTPRFLLLAAALFGLAGTAAAQTLQKAEYYIDTDPGLGLGSQINLAPAALATATLDIDLTPVQLTALGASMPGVHRLCFRFLDSADVWSPVQLTSFVIEPPDPLADLVSMEWTVSRDGAVLGSGATPVSPQAAATNMDFSALVPGLTHGQAHQLTLRAVDAAGRTGSEATVSLTPFSPDGPEFVVFSANFDDGVMPPQITPGTAGISGVQGYSGLGPVGNKFGGNLLRSATGNFVTLHLENLPPHTRLSVAFLFAAIDSLDGTGTFPAGDFFHVTLDGQTIFRESFANATPDQIQSYSPPGGVELARRVNLGFGQGGFDLDSAYNMALEPVFGNIPHFASSLTLQFIIEGAGIQDLNDESWGLDNLMVTLHGTGSPVPEIAVAQPTGTNLTDGVSSIDYGNATAGGTAVAKTFTVRNVGTSPLTLIAPAVSGGGAVDFVVNSTGMALSLAAGAVTNFTVTFTPQTSGAKAATLSIGSDDADESSFDIGLTGMGLNAVPAQSDPPLVFEGFDLEEGSLTGHEGATSVGWSSLWENNGQSGTVQTGSLVPPAGSGSYYTLPTRGNRGYSIRADFGGNMRNLGATLTGNTVCGSFLAQPSDQGGGIFVPFQTEQLVIGIGRGLDGIHKMNISLGFTSWTRPLSSQTGVALIIFQVDFNSAGINERLRVWLNSDPRNSIPLLDESTVDVGNPVFAFQYSSRPPHIRFSGTSPNGGGDFTFDEFRLGTTMESVIGYDYRAPVAAVTASATGTTGVARTVEVSAQSAFPADQAAGYTWAVDYGDGTTGSIPALAPSPSLLTHTWTTAGAYSIRARATDQNGRWSAYATTQIVISSVPVAPDIAIEQPVGTPLGGEVISWGYDAHGETDVPAGLTDVVQVSGGQYHTLAVRRDGTVAAWGYNAYGQTTLPAGLAGVTAVSAGARFSLALKNDGTVAAWGSNANTQTDVPPGLAGVTAIAAGGAHSLALKNDGTVTAWGSNSHGQRAVPAGLSGVTAIAAHGDNSLALKSDGTVIAWGGNDSGQSNVPAGLSSVTGIANGYRHSVAVKSDGSVVCWGLNDYGQCDIPSGLGNVIAVACGGWHTAALKSDGTVVAWGYNSAGQATPPAGLTGVSAIAAGEYHTLALHGNRVDFGPHLIGGSATRTFTVRNTGSALLTLTSAAPVGGQAAEFTVDLSATSPTVAASGTTTFTVTFAPAAAGIRSTTLRVVSDDPDEGNFDITLTGEGIPAPEIEIEQPAGLPLGGVVSAWGYNGQGQNDVPTGLDNVTAIAGGQYFTLALRNDGTVTGWGYNGQMQLNHPNNLGPCIAISAGARHSMALQSDGTVRAWGFNTNGQTNVPGDLAPVVAIAAGGHHCLALQSNGLVRAWGSISHSQTSVPSGLTDVVAISAYGDTSMALKSDGTVVAWGGNSSGQTNVPAGLSGVVGIANGYGHSVAVKSDGSVVTWGLNDYGQRDIPAGLGPVVAVACGGWHTVALLADGTVKAWGYNSAGQATPPADLTGVTRIAAGEYHTLALRGHAADFGLQFTGTTSAARSFTIRNTGTGALAISSISLTGGNAADFSVNAAGLPASVAPGGVLSFTASFTPSAVGSRSTTLRIASNDTDEAMLDIALRGFGGTPLQSWREQHFGSTANAGPGANDADPDDDGIANIVEHALLSDPLSDSQNGLPAGQTVVYPEGKRLTLEFDRSAERSDITIIVEANDKLDGTWTELACSVQGAPFAGPGTVSETTPIPGGLLRHVTVRDVVNQENANRRYTRVRVTSP